MLLWIDVRNGAYGLEQETGYTDNDRKAVDFQVDKGLRLEVAQTLGATVRGRNLPAIHFQPDGSLGLNSPATITIFEGDSKPMWIVQTQNGLTYEIENENQRINNTFR